MFDSTPLGPFFVNSFIDSTSDVLIISKHIVSPICLQFARYPLSFPSKFHCNAFMASTHFSPIALTVSLLIKISVKSHLTHNIIPSSCAHNISDSSKHIRIYLSIYIDVRKFLTRDVQHIYMKDTYSTFSLLQLTLCFFLSFLVRYGNISCLNDCHMAWNTHNIS